MTEAQKDILINIVHTKGEHCYSHRIQIWCSACLLYSICCQYREHAKIKTRYNQAIELLPEDEVFEALL